MIVTQLSILICSVEIDGKILVDGGVVNNYWGSTQVGADIVIGVDVQDGLLDRNQLKTQQKYCSKLQVYSLLKGWKRSVSDTEFI
jgi:NTE family protein